MITFAKMTIFFRDISYNKNGCLAWDIMAHTYYCLFALFLCLLYLQLIIRSKAAHGILRILSNTLKAQAGQFKTAKKKSKEKWYFIHFCCIRVCWSCNTVVQFTELTVSLIRKIVILIRRLVGFLVSLILWWRRKAPSVGLRSHSAAAFLSIPSQWHHSRPLRTPVEETAITRAYTKPKSPTVFRQTC